MGRVPEATSRWSPNTTSPSPNMTWLPVFGPFSRKNQVHRLYHVALEPQHDMALTQCDVTPTFDPFSARKTGSPPQPRRVGTPTRHRVPPMRRGALFWSLFRAKTKLPALTTSRWSPNTTSLPSNATWRPLLDPFLLKNRACGSSHVALEPQQDFAPSQCDVAPCFWTFFAQKPGSPPQPRRVGAPTRHGTHPMRRGATFCSSCARKLAQLHTKSSRSTPAGAFSLWAQDFNAFVVAVKS